MSKKQKRSVSSTAPDETINSTPSTSVAAPRRFSSVSTEFNPDYSHVIAGLKRIGLLAAGALVVMIILTFIIK